MILSDNAIRDKKLIEPFDEALLQPASYDLTLKEVKKPGGKGKRHVEYIAPGEFLLASTVERVSVPTDLVGLVAGKSSLARKGLSIHDAGFIDPGFTGEITLELYNKSTKTISLVKGMPIGQICFFTMDAPAGRGYDGHYQNQKGATDSWMEQK